MSGPGLSVLPDGHRWLGDRHFDWRAWMTERNLLPLPFFRQETEQTEWFVMVEKQPKAELGYEHKTLII